MTHLTKHARLPSPLRTITFKDFPATCTTSYPGPQNLKMKFLSVTLVLLLATTITPTPTLAIPKGMCKIVINAHDKMLHTLQKPTTDFDDDREALLTEFIRSAELIEKEKCTGVKEVWPKLQHGDCGILGYRLEENERWDSTCGNCPWLTRAIETLGHVLGETGCGTGSA